MISAATPRSRASSASFIPVPSCNRAVGDDEIVIAAFEELGAARERFGCINLVMRIEPYMLDEDPNFQVILNQQDTRHAQTTVHCSVANAR